MTLNWLTRRRTLAAMVMTSVALATTACGNSEPAPSGSTASKIIKITIQGKTTTPRGDRVQVARDQPVIFDVTADVAGQLHIHTDPEQVLKYQPGTSRLRMKPVGKPGVVAVEDHALDTTIVQLQAS